MSLFSLIVALLLEQLHPLPYKKLVATPVARLAVFLEKNFNAGRYRHGVLAWCLAVLPATLLVIIIYYLCTQVHPLLGWLWNVLVLYFTMGFRQFSHSYTAIQFALKSDDLPQARQLLAEWLRQPNHHMHSAHTERLVFNTLSAGEISRLSIEEALSASHRHVFGVLLFFILLPGPAGAVLYRLTALMAESLRNRRDEDNEEFCKFSLHCLYFIDWLPARVTAMSFAIAGNFEDAAHCWLTQSRLFADRADSNLGLVLASGAGSLGLRLGASSTAYSGLEDSEFSDDPVIGLGDSPDQESMQRAVGLVWRTVLLWVFLLLLAVVVKLMGQIA